MVANDLMTKPKTQIKTNAGPKSEPLKNFELNLDGAIFFLNETGTKHLKRRLASLKQLVKRELKAGVIVDATRLIDSLSTFGSAFAEDIRMVHFRNEWFGVMLITFLVAYLEDCLFF
jgi:hypothetical protein